MSFSSWLRAMWNDGNGQRRGSQGQARPQSRRPRLGLEQLEDRITPAESIAGTVFEDFNANGVRDPNEPGQAGVTIYLDLNRNAIHDGGYPAIEPITVTDAYGNYQFNGIRKGNYVVREITPEGFQQTLPGPGIANAGPSVFFGTVYVDGAGQTQLAEIDAGTAQVTRIGAAMSQPIHGLVMTNDGSLYGVNGGHSGFYSVNRTTGQVTQISLAGRQLAAGLTYDSATDTIYGLVVTNALTNEVSLFIFNPKTGVATPFAASTTALNSVSGLAFDWVNNRVLALNNNNQQLYAFDVTTGAASLLSTLSQSAFSWGLAFDGQNVVINWNNGSGTLGYHNPATGALAYVRTMSEPAIVESLEYLRSEPFARRVTASSDYAVTGIDFGNRVLPLASIQGTIFEDYNADGARDPNEPAMAGVTVFLDHNRNGVRDTSGTPESSAVTDANGNYTFNGVKSGVHVVREILPAGYDQSLPGPGIASAGPGVFFGTATAPETQNTQLVEIDATTGTVTRIGPDMGLQITGLVMTNDGSLFGIDGSSDNFYRVNRMTGQATLIGGAGLNVASVLTYDPYTDTIYGFGLLGPASDGHVLAIFNRTTGAAALIGQVTFVAPPIDGLAFDNVNNVIFAFVSSQRTLLAIHPISGHVISQSQQLPPGGYYNGNLAFDGQYAVISEYIDNEFRLGYYNPFSGELVKSKALSEPVNLWSLEYIQTEPFTRRVIVEPDQTVTGIDFGNFLPYGSVTGTIFEDYDADGVRDPNEPAMAGVSVYLDVNRNAIYDTSGTPEPSLVTDGNGNYAFNGIPWGTYVVREVVPALHRQTLPGPGIANAGPGVYFATGFDPLINQPLPLMEIDAQKGKVTRIGATIAEPLQGLVMTNDGSLYGINGLDKFNRVDRTTGQITYIGSAGFILSGGLAYDPITDTIYGASVTTIQGVSAFTLLTFNRTTGAATPFLPSIVSMDGLSGLAFDSVNNRVLALDSNELYAFDPVTGTGTLLSVLQFPLGGIVSSLAFDGQHVVVGQFFGNGRSSISYFNPATGALIKTKAMSERALITALEFIRSEPFTHRVQVAGGLTVTADFGNKGPNRAPVANAGGPYTIFEGDSLTLNASGSSDVEGSSLSYAWDLDNDGHFDDATGANPTLTWEQLTSRGIADSGTYTARVRVTDTDPDGALSTIASVNLSVLNAAPTSTGVAASSVGVIGQPVAFTLSAFDPSLTDRNAGFTFTLDWDGNGTIDQTVLAPSGTTITHAYTAVGTYTVRVTAIDKDGGTSPETTHTITITQTLLVADPLAPGKFMLLVGGTSGNDDIVIGKLSRDGTVSVTLNHMNLGGFASPGGEFSRVVIYAQAGNDDIRVHSANKFSAWLYGGDGNDRLRGGGGADVLLGEASDDLLAGNGGRNLLIGGTGADSIVGGEQDDIIITGYTLFDGNEQGLSSIMAEWTSGRSWMTRVQNIRDGSGSANRANGNYFLRDRETVFQDGAADTVAMTPGPDLMYFEPVRDQLTDLTNAIFIPNLGFILGD